MAPHSGRPESTCWDCASRHTPEWQGQGPGATTPTLQKGPPARGPELLLSWPTPRAAWLQHMAEGRWLRVPGEAAVCLSCARAPAACCGASGAAHGTPFLHVLSAHSRASSQPRPRAVGAAEPVWAFLAASGNHLTPVTAVGVEAREAQRSFNQQETPPFSPKLFARPVN